MNVLELTRQLIRFDTINPPGAEGICARHVGRLLEEANFSVTFHELPEERPSLVARIGGSASRPPLCFTGHLDTVPLGVQPWRHDPFAGEVAGGRLYGRGSSDMKGGVAAFMTAALRLAPRLTGTPGLVLVITAGEETGCQGAQHLAALGGVLGQAGAIVAGEPTGNYPCVGHKGLLWLVARTTGVTAHGSMPERGDNAVHKAARAVNRLEWFRFGVPPHPVLGAPTLNVGLISGGLNINSVPDSATIGIDVRTLPDQKHQAVLERLAHYLGDEVQLAPVMDLAGVWTETDDPWIQEVYEVVTPVLGARPAVRGAPYVTDASVLTPAYGGVPTVILGPGEMALAHQTDEYCAVRRLEEAVVLYEEIARRWCRL
jgi:succinyl-diaminopimelate desuccinylase